MINPGVITLATLNGIEYVNFPYRFCVEDNIGEAIHIHYKDIRLDLTTAQFKEVAEQAKAVINSIVEVENFNVADFDPVFLVAISPRLADLRKIETREVYLEDILVDTYDAEGNPMYANIKHSRVFKALCGIAQENDNYKVQFNHFQAGMAEKLTNQERLLWNLEQVKKDGYPTDGNLITVTPDNIIQDGQHRAACLYYLYGNIKVPVRTLVFDDAEEPLNAESEWKAFERELWEQALRAKQSNSVLFQVFFDTGSGFSEENSIKTTYNPYAEKPTEIKFPVPQGTRRLRIDPADRACAITLKNMRLLPSETDISCTDRANNAIFANGGEYLFVSNDPQLYVDDIQDVSEMSVAFEYGDESVIQSRIVDIIAKETESIKLEMQTQVTRLESEISDLKNSRSWKITKPLRLAAKILKKS